MLFVVLGGVGGYLATRWLPRQYTAQASVLVNAIGQANASQPVNGRTINDVNLDTEAQIVRSQPVTQRALELDPTLAGLPQSQLTSHLNVSVPPNSTVLDISFTASTPTAARAGANAFTRGYLADRRVTARIQVDRQVGAAERQVHTIENQLQAIVGQLQHLPKTSGLVSSYATQRDLLVAQISDLNAQLLALQTGVVNVGRMLQPATVPTARSSPSLIIDIASGLAAGLLLGALAAWAAMRWRRKLRSGDDVVELADAPVLATVPVLQADIDDWHRAAAADVYRRLAVATVAPLATPAVVLVVSIDRSRAARALATGLSGALADDGSAVRTVHLGAAAAGQAGGQPALELDRLDDLRDVVPAPSLHDRLQALRNGDTYLIADVPDALTTSDAHRLAPLVDAVLILVTSGTRRRDLRTLVRGLDAVGAPLLGSVFVRRVSGGKIRGKVGSKAAPAETTDVQRVERRAMPPVAGSASKATVAPAKATTAAPARARTSEPASEGGASEPASSRR